MNAKIKTTLLVLLLGLSLSTSGVTYAAGLSVCGEGKSTAPVDPKDPRNTTPYDNYNDYATFLANQRAKHLTQEQFDAQDSAYKTTHGICQPSDIFKQIARITNYLIGFIGVLVVIKIVVAGFQMVIAQGNSEAVQNAKGSITNAMIGLVIVMSAFLIANIIFSTAGVSGFNINPFAK
jgi:hypothetical protein